MALDHYISQVHLKNFYSPELENNLMYAIKKSDQKLFTPTAKSVCRIEQGSTNTYLNNEREIEIFLSQIEPNYNSSVKKTLNCQFDDESIHTIAGFVSYIITCSPAAMRIHSEPFRSTVAQAAQLLDKSGKIPPPPEQLGGENLTTLIENGTVTINIDEKYPQAHGISSVLSHTAIFCNSNWEILINSFQDSPFFSSDYPVAIEPSDNPNVLNRIIPLTPFLAIRIKPNIHATRNNPNLDFSNFSYKKKQLSRAEVRRLNQLFVQCAETMVFFSNKESWVVRFVEKNSQFRIKPKTNKMSHLGNTILQFSQEISNYQYT